MHKMVPEYSSSTVDQSFSHTQNLMQVFSTKSPNLKAALDCTFCTFVFNFLIFDLRQGYQEDFSRSSRSAYDDYYANYYKRQYDAYGGKDSTTDTLSLCTQGLNVVSAFYL